VWAVTASWMRAHSAWSPGVSIRRTGRRLVQFPAGSRRGSIFLCLLYRDRVERGETNKECRRPLGRTYAPPLTVVSVYRNVPRQAIPDRVRPTEDQPQPMSNGIGPSPYVHRLIRQSLRSFSWHRYEKVAVYHCISSPIVTRVSDRATNRHANDFWGREPPVGRREWQEHLFDAPEDRLRGLS